MAVDLLVFSSDGPVPEAWFAPLRARLGAGAVDGGPCRDLVREAEAHAPEHIVVLGSVHGVAALADAAGRWPVSVVSAAPDLASWAEGGLAGWWPPTLPADDLLAGLSVDRARWRRERSVAEALADVQSRLDDRKWVDRAKGVLAQARGLGEDEAFRLLRGAAMQTKLRIGEVSRSVIEAQTFAEAVNQAGQLRMLSQRLVKLAALGLAGVDAHRTRRLRDESLARGDTNLAGLATLATSHPVLGEPLGTAQAAWVALRAALDGRTTADGLSRADTVAEALLASADRLVGVLEEVSGRRALKVVNLCGRQRMLVQRLAKAALLGEVLGRGAEGLDELRDLFEASLVELELAPLSTPEIRAGLAEARTEWRSLLQGVQGVHQAEGRAGIARASEALQAAFDQLTASYERSIQLLMS